MPIIDHHGEEPIVHFPALSNAQFAILISPIAIFGAALLLIAIIAF